MMGKGREGRGASFAPHQHRLPRPSAAGGRYVGGSPRFHASGPREGMGAQPTKRWCSTGLGANLDDRRNEVVQ
jgi:hypothetical protein